MGAHFTIPVNTYPVGIYEHAVPPTVLRTFRGLTYRMTREAWPAGVDYTDRGGTVRHEIVCAVLIEFSINGIVWDCALDDAHVGGVRATDYDEGRFTWNADKLGDARVRLVVLAPIRTAIAGTLQETGD